MLKALNNRFTWPKEASNISFLTNVQPMSAQEQQQFCTLQHNYCTNYINGFSFINSIEKNSTVIYCAGGLLTPEFRKLASVYMFHEDIVV